MFWNNLIELCEKKNVSISKMCADINMSPSAPARWRDGKMPNGESLNKISKYFGVSVIELIADKKEKPYLNIDEIGLSDDMSLPEMKKMFIFYINLIKIV